MSHYRYVGPDGNEVEVDGVNGLIEAVAAGQVGPETLVREEGAQQWAQASGIIPSAFQVTEEPPDKPKSPVPVWVAVGVAFAYGLWSSRQGITANSMGYALGTAIGVCLLAVVLLRFFKSVRHHWPILALVIAALFGLAELGDRAEVDTALDDLDATISDVRSIVADARAASDFPPAPSTTAEENDALARFAARAAEVAREVDRDLGVEFELEEQPVGWMENDYYVRPSVYTPEVPDHINRLRDYGIASANYFLSETNYHTVLPRPTR